MPPDFGFGVTVSEDDTMAPLAVSIDMPEITIDAEYPTIDNGRPGDE